MFWRRYRLGAARQQFEIGGWQNLIIIKTIDWVVKLCVLCNVQIHIERITITIFSMFVLCTLSHLFQ